MSKRNQYDKDEIFEQTESGYYYPPMFRYPEDDEMRQANPNMSKKPLSDNNDMLGGMQIGMEPGMDASMPSQTLQGLPVIPQLSQQQPTVQDIGFTQAFLRTIVGKRVRIEFLIGTNIMTDKSGILEEVGISYVVLREESGTRVMCDLYSIKFVNIFQ